MDAAKFKEYGEKVVNNCSKVIVGKDKIIKQVLTIMVLMSRPLLENLS